MLDFNWNQLLLCLMNAKLSPFFRCSVLVTSIILDVEYNELLKIFIAFTKLNILFPSKRISYITPRMNHFQGFYCYMLYVLFLSTRKFVLE